MNEEEEEPIPRVYHEEDYWYVCRNCIWNFTNRKWGLCSDCTKEDEDLWR
jgi:hypothetical protein